MNHLLLAALALFIGADFDRSAAAKALVGVDLSSCAAPDGPTGSGHVTVTFANDETAASAVVDDRTYPGTPVGACVAGRFYNVTVPPFDGAPVRVGKAFTIPAAAR